MLSTCLFFFFFTIQTLITLPWINTLFANRIYFKISTHFIRRQKTCLSLKHICICTLYARMYVHTIDINTIFISTLSTNDRCNHRLTKCHKLKFIFRQFLFKAHAAAEVEAGQTRIGSWRTGRQTFSEPNRRICAVLLLLLLLLLLSHLCSLNGSDNRATNVLSLGQQRAATSLPSTMRNNKNNIDEQQQLQQRQQQQQHSHKNDNKNNVWPNLKFSLYPLAPLSWLCSPFPSSVHCGATHFPHHAGQLFWSFWHIEKLLL